MKNSGIEWIGLIPNTWSIKKIKYSLLRPITDGPHETPVFINEGVPFLSVDCIQNNKLVLGNRYISIEDANIYDKKCRPQYGDILMGKAASIGKIAIVDINDRFQIWSPLALIRTNKNKLYNRFLKFYLESDCGQEYINNYSTKNTQMNIAMEDIEKIKIVMPSLKEQHLIADFLEEKVDNIDNIILNLSNQIEILKKYKNQITTETITKGLRKNVLYKNSNNKWIGDIPNSWDIKRLKYLISDMKVGPFGSALSGDDIKSEGDYWIYNQRTVLDNNFIDCNSFVTEDKYCELKSFKVYPNDVLLTTRGTIGKVAIVPNNIHDGILHPCLIRFKANESLIKKELIEIIFNYSNIVTNQLFYLSNSTTIEVIYSYNLKDICLPLIPMNEQIEIINYLNKKYVEIDNLINSKTKQKEQMEQYKKSVIYEYVTGKKRVEGAEELYG